MQLELSTQVRLCECGCGKQTPIAKTSNTLRGAVKGQPARFLLGHRHPRNQNPYTVEGCGYKTRCWVWTGALNGPRGYAVLERHNKQWFAHRWYYTQAKGPIPEGLELDHLCRVRRCVNPDHLEPVTRSENMLRAFAAIREGR